MGVRGENKPELDLRRILMAQVASTAGSQLAFVATPLAAYLLTGSASAAGAVGVGNALVRTASALFAGAVADRFDQRRTMLTCDITRTVITLLIALLIMGRVGGVIAFGLLIMAEGVFSSLFTPAQAVAIRRIAPRDRLATYVARNESASWAATLACPPLGGLLFTIEAGLPFLGNALSYVLSALCLWRLGARSTIHSERQTRRHALHPGELLAGLRFVVADRFLRAVVSQIALHNVALGALSLMVVVGATQRGVPEPAIGVLVAVQALGATIGGLCATAILRRLRAGQVVLFTGWMWVALIPLIVATRAWGLEAVLLGVLWFLAPVQRTVVGTYQGQRVPVGTLGRVNSAVGLLGGCLAAIGPGVGGALLDVGRIPLSVLVLTAITLPPLVASTFVARIGRVTVAVGHGGAADAVGVDAQDDAEVA